MTDSGQYGRSVLTLEAWRVRVLEHVVLLADEAFQRRAWFYEGPEMSSPEQDYAALFDVALFDEFVEMPANLLTLDQRRAGQRLCRLLDEFFEPVRGEFAQAEEVIEDPRWYEIRRAAKQFVESMKN